jgi:hypothetical protein
MTSTMTKLDIELSIRPRALTGLGLTLIYCIHFVLSINHICIYPHFHRGYTVQLALPNAMCVESHIGQSFTVAHTTRYARYHVTCALPTPAHTRICGLAERLHVVGSHELFAQLSTQELATCAACRRLTLKHSWSQLGHPRAAPSRTPSFTVESGRRMSVPVTVQ